MGILSIGENVNYANEPRKFYSGKYLVIQVKFVNFYNEATTHRILKLSNLTSNLL